MPDWIRPVLTRWLPGAALIAASMACGSSSSATPELVNTSDAPGAETVAEPTAAREDTPTEAQEPTLAPETATPQRPTTFEVGDPIHLGDFVVVVLGWEPIVSDNDFIKPDPGNQFVGVELIIVNVAESSEGVSSLLSTSLKDSTDQVYRTDFSAAAGGSKSGIDGVLLPGERIRGQVGFQVPDDASGLVFVFDAELFDAGRLFVNLPAEPGLIEPPAAVEGEKPISGAAPGEPVPAGDFSVTFNGVEDVKASQFMEPDEGYKFIAVDVTIENTSGEPQNLSTLAQMYVRAPDGQRYSVDLGAAVGAGSDSPDGEIAAGERLRGKIGFQVPVDASGLLFGFLAGLFGGEPIYIALN